MIFRGKEKKEYLPNSTNSSLLENFLFDNEAGPNEEAIKESDAGQNFFFSSVFEHMRLAEKDVAPLCPQTAEVVVADVALAWVTKQPTTAALQYRQRKALGA